MADVPDPARHLLSLDLPVRTSIHEAFAGEAFVGRVHPQQFLRDRYSTHLLRRVPRPEIVRLD